MQRSALIVIDMLNDFLDHWEPDSKDSLIRSVNALVATMREHDRPIIWVRQEFEADLSDAFPQMRKKQISITIKGTRGCQIASSLSIVPSDPVVIKKRYSAFHETNLDKILGELGIRSLIVAGINTHACVRATTIDAYQRDLNVIIAADCVDSYDREHHEISLRYIAEQIGPVMTNQEILSALTQSGL